MDPRERQLRVLRQQATFLALIALVILLLAT